MHFVQNCLKLFYQNYLYHTTIVALGVEIQVLSTRPKKDDSNDYVWRHFTDVYELFCSIQALDYFYATINRL